MSLAGSGRFSAIVGPSRCPVRRFKARFDIGPINHTYEKRRYILQTLAFIHAQIIERQGTPSCVAIWSTSKTSTGEGQRQGKRQRVKGALRVEQMFPYRDMAHNIAIYRPRQRG